jgi:hypothetical protein
VDAVRVRRLLASVRRHRNRRRGAVMMVVFVAMVDALALALARWWRKRKTSPLAGALSLEGGE